MKHLGTKTIETERLILRRAQIGDGAAMYRNWASDPEVTKFLTWPTHGSPEISEQIVAFWAGEYGKENFYQWMIVWKEIGEPIGSISVVQMNDQVQSAEIGYCMGRNWWHKGIMSEALQAVMDYLFDEVGFRRIEARHDPRNPNSGGVMRKCGMVYEGTSRQADRNNQGICDACRYGLLAEERRK